MKFLDMFFAFNGMSSASNHYDCLSIGRYILSLLLFRQGAQCAFFIYDQQSSMRLPLPLLRSYLSYLEHPCWNREPLVEYTERSELCSQEYPTPNVTLHEVLDPEFSGHSVEWTIYKILSRGSGNSGMNPLETDGSWSFDSILLDMCHQLKMCDIEM